MDLQKTIVLEIAVESVAAAQAAERGGANRIELCAELACGGLTPSAEMMREARRTIKIPIFAMIRPRGGDFVYTQEEFGAMKKDIELARELEMDGVVLGILSGDGAVDVERTRELVRHARPMQVTFHRAFDACRNLRRAMDDVIESGADRILTSGGERDVVSGMKPLRELVEAAGQRVIIMPGGGITPENFRQVQEKTGAREFHSGLGQVLEYGSAEMGRFETAVGELVTKRKTIV